MQIDEKKDATTFRLHQEVNRRRGSEQSGACLSREPHVCERRECAVHYGRAHCQASVIDALGSFQIMIQFDRRGTWLLEYTTAHRGRRIGIFSQFGDARWLAAPVMNKRIADGVLVFTPDASRGG